MKTFFFFFFFGDHLILGEKSLNFCIRSKNHSQFRWRHSNFWGFVLEIPPPPKFSRSATGLEDTFSSPWPWSLKSSKTALSSARGQHYFFNGKSFVDRLKNVFLDRFFWRSTEKKFLRPFFLGKHLHLCPWSLASSLVSSTPPLLTSTGVDSN